MQGRSGLRVYAWLLAFMIVLFLGLSAARAWAIPEPEGLAAGAAEEAVGWRLVLHLPEGGRQEFWLAEVFADSTGYEWNLGQPYLPLRLLAESYGRPLVWQEYSVGWLHSGAALWQGEAGWVVLLPGRQQMIAVSAGQARIEQEHAQPVLLADTLCLPLQLLEPLGLQFQLDAARRVVEVWPGENSAPEADLIGGNIAGTDYADSINNNEENNYSENINNENIEENADGEQNINIEETGADWREAWRQAEPLLAEIWAEELRGELLAAAETSFDQRQQNRSHNLYLAAEALHGRQVAAGEEFSFNQAVGPRTAARGFRPATIFVARQPVQGLGGGICQVSSTLYLALRQTDLLVLERHAHSLAVDYAPAGGDATVAWGLKDLRWRNNLAEPVHLRCQIGGGRLRVEIWRGQAPSVLPELFILD